MAFVAYSHINNRDMWDVATCRRHGIHFSDGFLGVTCPIVSGNPADLKEVHVTGHWQVPSQL